MLLFAPAKLLWYEKVKLLSVEIKTLAWVKLNVVFASVSVSHCFKVTIAFTIGLGLTTRLNVAVK